MAVQEEIERLLTSGRTCFMFSYSRVRLPLQTPTLLADSSTIIIIIIILIMHTGFSEGKEEKHLLHLGTVRSQKREGKKKHIFVQQRLKCKQNHASMGV